MLRRVQLTEPDRRDEERARLEAAVKADDSLFTILFVSPYSKYLARFAARRGWRPNAITTLSFAVGALAAASFALGTRASLIAAAVLLQVSFTIDCVDGQLARYTGDVSAFGGWLDSLLDRVKECLVYAGLALGATRGFGEDVWLLAACSIALLTVRHSSDFAWVASRARAASVADARRPAGWVHRVNQLLRLPIGERFLLISLTAAIASPRLTFVALLAWGGVGVAYALAVRVFLSLAARPGIAGVA
jgi:phosphatidylglycerophosphate synthase